MTDISAYLGALLWQPEPPQSATDAIQFTVTVGLFLVAIIIAMFFVFRAVRPKLDRSAGDAIREELDRSKDALLLAAQAKKAARESDESARRQQESEEKERELLRQNVDPQRVYLDAVGVHCHAALRLAALQRGPFSAAVLRAPTPYDRVSDNLAELPVLLV